MAKEKLEDRSERREHPRYAVNIDADIWVGSDKLHGRLVDISVDGLRISVPKAIKPSSDLMVAFTLRAEIKIWSRAVWTLEQSSTGLPVYLVGLKIYSVQANNKDIEGMARRTALFDKLLK